MKRVKNTYWRKGGVSKKRRGMTFTTKKRGKNTPEWFSFAVVVSVTFLLCIAINFRAFSEMRSEYNENYSLNEEIDNLKIENSGLRSEVKNLKDDPNTIAREARKRGMSRPNEKVLVPIK